MATIKHDASRCDLYTHIDALPWLKWLTLSLNWAERDVTEDVSSHTTPPLWILFPIARESPANILSSAGLKLTSEWLATPGRREAQQERGTAGERNNIYYYSNIVYLLASVSLMQI